MVLNNVIIERIKEKSGLSFEKAKDFDILVADIFSKTKRSVGVTTAKRLLGYIADSRKANEFTLNTIAIYLGFEDWIDLMSSIRFDSDWDFNDDSVYVSKLAVGSHIEIKYLNRIVDFAVFERDGQKVLVVEKVQNGSLKNGDILFAYSIKKGEIFECNKVLRGVEEGNYRTNGEVMDIKIW